MDYLQYKNYLAHHGIDGQKWGERNGPPYPLDYDDHTTEQKKLNPKSVIDGVKSDFKKTNLARQVKTMKKQKKFVDAAGNGFQRNIRKAEVRYAGTNPNKDHIAAKAIGTSAVIATAGVGFSMFEKSIARSKIIQHLSVNDIVNAQRTSKIASTVMLGIAAVTAAGIAVNVATAAQAKADRNKGRI